MAEQYADTVKGKGSSPFFITYWFVTQLDKECRSFKSDVVSSSLTGPTKRKYSSMVERVVVNHLMNVRFILFPLYNCESGKVEVLRQSVKGLPNGLAG